MALVLESLVILAT